MLRSHAEAPRHQGRVPASRDPEAAQARATPPPGAGYHAMVYRAPRRGAAHAEPVSDDAAAVALAGAARDGSTAPPAGVRRRVEERTGVDLRDARIREGAGSSAAAAAFEARAFTFGRDVCFGDGEYRPGTGEGDRLLAHELVHVAQQRGGAAPPARGAVSRPGDAAEIEAGEVAAAALGPAAREAPAAPLRAKPSGAVSLQGGAPAKPLKYDTGTFTGLKAPPKGTTLAAAKSAIASSQAASPPDLGPKVDVAGVTAGSNAEIFLYWLLAQVGMHDRWGTEADIVFDTDWASGTTAAPKGLVTVRIDDKGNATAELVGTGPVAVTSRYKDLAAAKKGVQAAFGFKSVTEEGTAVWTPEELDKVHAALALMPAADQAALKDLDLVRVSTATDESGNAVSGLYKHEESVPQGGTTATVTASIRIADSAFTGDKVAFVGGKGTALPSSAQTILHEAGHAVEDQLLHAAKGKNVTAIAAHNDKLAIFNAADSAVGAVVTKFNAELKAVAPKVPKYKDPLDIAYAQALDKATKPINALGTNATPADSGKLTTAADTAVATRDAAKAKLGASSAAASDLATLHSLQDDWLTAAKARVQPLADEQSTLAAQTASAAGVTAASAGAQSKRLKKFVDFVNSKSIKPLTDYAQKNWPAHAEEFYAEAYSLWLSDKQYLTTNAKPLADWFDNGEHLK